MENWLKEILERAWGSGVRSSFVLDQNLVPGSCHTMFGPTRLEISCSFESPQHGMNTKYHAWVSAVNLDFSCASRTDQRRVRGRAYGVYVTKVGACTGSFVSIASCALEGPHFEIGGAVFTVWHPKRGVPMHGTTIDVARQFDLVSRLQYMPLAQLENKFQDGASSMCRDRYWLHPKTLCLIYKGTRLQKASNHKA
ncbi:hypothetical protein VNO77_26909 [Canavalia gladiata]|uniref:Uncharacterized protein n=1 Tax=Canavalia gladiata TaxID=3824 RepID=A0AAN9KVZ0_CANGL